MICELCDWRVSWLCLHFDKFPEWRLLSKSRAGTDFFKVLARWPSSILTVFKHIFGLLGLQGIYHITKEAVPRNSLTLMFNEGSLVTTNNTDFYKHLKKSSKDARYKVWSLCCIKSAKASFEVIINSVYYHLLGKCYITICQFISIIVILSGFWLGLYLIAIMERVILSTTFLNKLYKQKGREKSW